ncbi:PH domain-containing protein [Pseudothauera rhizosphaerae]|uniref:Uncharacterized protein YyaB-like PH domain-containing protein n=1 Tax=Pseudothauera rhizosphaerae TaxID=2565932 RepID=A0A4S4AMB6_9RHOO|nr:PH domain-containing protein [Pseudothauera rhizosphaerae]THF60729.1 hypothetical protein E6O51_13215 [Pseudothauera rhizosphaerae]
MGTVYKSKIDAWLAVLLVGTVAGCVWAGFVAGRAGGFIASWLSALLFSLGAGLPLWILLGTRYVLDAESLRVECGPFRWQVPLTGITAVTPTSSFLSSPALSLDRLRIDYKPGASVMISPRDKEGFLRQLDALRREAAGEGG